MRRVALLALALVLACGSGVAPRVASPGSAVGDAQLVDAEQIERGAQVFETRGCAACHTIGAGIRAGPDLAGLGDRRDPDWILAMIRRPDSMLAGDPVARELGFEYGATMPRVGIEAGDARALAAFLAAPGDVDMPTAPGHGCPGCRHRAGHWGSPRSH